jgi:hypothetical protein
MSAIAPFASSSFAPEERPQPAPAKAKEAHGRTGRHEPIRSSTPRIAARGAVLGLTMAAGVGAGVHYLEHDPELALLAGAQVGSVAAGLAVRLAADGTPDDEAAARLLGLRGADRVALEQAARRTAGDPEHGRALGLLGRVAVLRALL